MSITNASDLVRMIFNWNGANYTYYDDGIKLMMDFENLSSIGENETFVVDASQYPNNGSVVGASFNRTGGHDGRGAFRCDF